jgi:hypothetical protein
MGRFPTPGNRLFFIANPLPLQSHAVGSQFDGVSLNIPLSGGKLPKIISTLKRDKIHEPQNDYTPSFP